MAEATATAARSVVRVTVNLPEIHLSPRRWSRSWWRAPTHVRHHRLVPVGFRATPATIPRRYPVACSRLVVRAREPQGPARTPSSLAGVHHPLATPRD